MTIDSLIIEALGLKTFYKYASHLDLLQSTAKPTILLFLTFVLKLKCMCIYSDSHITRT